MPKYIAKEKKRVIIKRFRGYGNPVLKSGDCYFIEANSMYKAEQEYKKIQYMRKQAELLQVVTTTSDTTETKSK